MSKSAKIRAYLRKHPNAKVSTMANLYKCSRGLVYNVIAKQRQNGSEKKPDRATPIANVVNAKKVPQNAPASVLTKRVVVKKSFLWGAFKLERYE
tara:strand:+ start:9367 stop:9651 length:285 start_codon:yes stop_codon:yes gene_type:complete